MVKLRMYLLLFCLISYVNSLFCYVCSGCNDPFQVGSLIGQYYPDNSGYYCRKTSSSNVVTRDASTSCTQSGSSGNGQWCCQTDVCNHGIYMHSSANMFLILFIHIFISLRK